VIQVHEHRRDQDPARDLGRAPAREQRAEREVRDLVEDADPDAVAAGERPQRVGQQRGGECQSSEADEPAAILRRSIAFS
jgi:hypothetical protein